jgi:SAM-dependent methyltransferase
MFRTVSLLLTLISLVLVAPASRGAESEDAKPAAGKARTPDVVYVPTPNDVVDKMLEMAQVKKGDVVYDLGCGDGRIVVAAAKKGATANGYDIAPERVEEAKANVRKNKVEQSAKIFAEDVFTLDLSKANVITLYLLPRLNVRLIPQLEKLKAGSRIVSHDFDMQGVTPDRVVKMVSQEDGQNHTIYLWTVPLKKTKDAE